MQNIISQKPVEPSVFSNLHNMLEYITIPYRDKTSMRYGFKKHRACAFGLTRGRKSNKIQLSYMSLKHPEIWEELQNIGKIICPEIDYTSVYVNNNVICPKHRDNNIGYSCLISFGGYTGGNIVINNEVYDANCNAIIFDASQNEHFNTDDLKGNKYSLVFYKMPM